MPFHFFFLLSLLVEVPAGDSFGASPLVVVAEQEEELLVVDVGTTFGSRLRGRRRAGRAFCAC